jgi:hypothetical protein
MSLGTPKAGAKCKLLFNKLASGTAVGNGKEKMAKIYFFLLRLKKSKFLLKFIYLHKMTKRFQGPGAVFTTFHSLRNLRIGQIK